MEKNRDKNEAWEEFLDLATAKPAVRAVLEHFDATRDDLSVLRIGLEHWGAGQMVRGHLVSVSMFYYAFTLFYLLEGHKKSCPIAN